MDQNIYILIKRLDNIAKLYHVSLFIKTKVEILALNADQYHIQNINLNNKAYNFDTYIRDEIFNLLINITNTNNTSIEFLLAFSDLIVEIIDKESKNEKDISDLISALNKLSISFGLNKQISNIRSGISKMNII